MDKWGFQLGNKPAGSEHVQGRISGESVSHSDCVTKGVIPSESISFLLCEAFVCAAWASHIYKHIFPFGIGGQISLLFIPGRLPGEMAPSPKCASGWGDLNPGSCIKNTKLLSSECPLLPLPVSSHSNIWREWTACDPFLCIWRIWVGTTRTSYLLHSMMDP